MMDSRQAGLWATILRKVCRRAAMLRVAWAS